MRKLATTALTALSISLLGSAAALADAPHQGPQGPGYQGPGYNQPHSGPQNPHPGQGQWNQGQGQGQWNQGPRGGDRHFDEDRFDGGRDGRFDGGRFGERGFEDHRFDNDRRFNRNFDFRLHFGNSDRWERGWGHGNYHNQYRFHQPMNHWRLVRMLERQGFYGVRGLQKARFGFGYRAFAFNQRGRPVMLRINPFTGRVMDVRYI